MNDNKENFILHGCLVMLYDKFFIVVCSIYTNSPILSLAPFVDFHCWTMPFSPAMMNSVHFLWIVSHIFSLFLIAFGPAVCVCEMQILFIEKKSCDRSGKDERKNMTNDSHSYFVFDEKWDHKTRQKGRRQAVWSCDGWKIEGEFENITKLLCAVSVKGIVRLIYQKISI